MTCIATLSHHQSPEAPPPPKVPPPPSNGRSYFLKTRIRNVFDFAIASVAISLTVSGNEISSSRVVFGGVAPSPYRDLNVEAKLNGSSLALVDPNAAADAALSGATPLQNNAYKVDVAKGLLKEALGQLVV